MINKSAIVTDGAGKIITEPDTGGSEGKLEIIYWILRGKEWKAIDGKITSRRGNRSGRKW